MKRHHFLSATLPVVFSVILLGAFTISSAQEKTKITKLDDLPRYSYKIEGQVVDFLKSDSAVLKLADEVKRDLEKDLAKFVIDDKTTLQGYYRSLGDIALIKEEYDTYLEYLARYRALEDKEGIKLTLGLLEEAYATVKKRGTTDFESALTEELTKTVASLPYEVVEADIKQLKAESEILSENLIYGQAKETIQPQIDKSGGEISGDIARTLLYAVETMRYFIPYKHLVTQIIGKYLEVHKVVKPNIWPDREVDLSRRENLSPVILAVWDSGTDTDIFEKTGQLWTNKKETPGNLVDDDKNGFVDDVHGIAWSLDNEPELFLLFDIGDVGSERQRLQSQLKGYMDLQANIDSKEAQELLAIVSKLEQDEYKPLVEGLNRYNLHSHGTHVSGIAVRGNPAARVLVARLTFNYHLIPILPTIERARKISAKYKKTVEYFKENGVRAVNMSWGGTLREFEGALEQHNAGGTAGERKALARQIYQIVHDGLYDAIKNAPDILFFTAAGNADANVVFIEDYPSSFDLPNILSVGAVDQAGDETNFTSFGKVDICGNGFEVESYVPGGDQLKLSGTSMSSPQAMNLAGKLLAVKPDLTVAQLRQLIISAADERPAGERTIKLMNPKRSFEMLAEIK